MISILQKIRRLKHLFARQGAIVESWRYKNGQKLGPYYRLAYRAAGRQCSIYLGKSENLLRQVRRLLEKLQNPLKTSRILRRAQKAAQADLKRHMAQFRLDLLKVGLQLRGYAARGWRRFRALRRTSSAPLVPKLQLGNPHSPGCQPVQKCGAGYQPASSRTPHAPREGVCCSPTCQPPSFLANW
jgi:hypothetical protein